MKLNIKEGFDNVKFNMPVEEVVAILGQANEVENIDNAADETTTVLRYENITLFFEGENPTLSCIDVTNEDATLWGEEIFDMNEKEIVKLMVDNHYFEQDVDTEEWGERRVTFNEGNIDFFFEDDELMSVVFGK